MSSHRKMKLEIPKGMKCPSYAIRYMIYDLYVNQIRILVIVKLTNI